MSLKNYSKLEECFNEGIKRDEYDSLKSLVMFYIKLEDEEGIAIHRKKLFLSLELNQRLQVLEAIINMYIDLKKYDKAIRLSMFYKKYEYINASFLLAKVYEKEKDYQKAFEIYTDLLNNYQSKAAMKKIGEYYIYGYGVVKKDEAKGIEMIKQSGQKSGKELINICYLKGLCGKEMINKGFENLNQDIYQSKVSALYVYACYHFGYYVKPDPIEELKIYNLLMNQYKMKRPEILAFLIDNDDLNKKKINYSSIASRLLF